MKEREYRALNKMLRYLSDYKRESVLAPLFKMLEATFDLFVPLVMADIVNVGIAAHDFHYILVRCGILLLLAIVGLTCSLTAQYFSAKAAVGYSTGLRHALFEHIQTLSFSEMDTMGTSTLITRMTSDVNQVQSGLNLFLRLFLRSPFVVIGAMIMAFTVNFRAALIFVVAIPLLSVVVFGVMVITRPLYKSVQTRLDRVLGLTRENLTGVRVVRAFDKEKSEVDRFEDANELLTKMQLHVGHISALMNPLTYVIINLAIVALLYVGSIEINIGGMASGDVIALVNYMNQILVELVKLANLIVQVSKALACAGRVQAVLDTKPGMEFPAQLTGNVPAEKAGDAVRFDHVSLTYKGAGAPSLSDISFTAKRGQTIGVIGGTGSGKSSLISLIPRFYDATEGSVEIMGRPVRQYPRADLRGKVAVVMQKAQLFGGTIRSNLLWGSQNASDADLWAALETAQAAEFVKAKPLYTADLCRMLDLRAGLAAYPSEEDTLRQSLCPTPGDYRDFRVFRGYLDQSMWKLDPVIGTMACPVCGTALQPDDVWLKKGSSGWYTLSQCPVCKGRGGEAGRGVFQKYRMSRRDGLHWAFARCVQMPDDASLVRWKKQKAQYLERQRLKAERQAAEAEAARHIF